MTDTHTFTGGSLEEILPQIREALGDDAVVVGRRDVLSGGVGGFFAKRAIEVDARAPRPALDVYEDAPAEPEAYAPEPQLPYAPEPATSAAREALLAEAQQWIPEEPLAVEPPAFVEPAPVEPSPAAWEPSPPVVDAFAEHLARLEQDAPPPPAPVEQPVVFEQVAPYPTLDDILPEPRPQQAPAPALPTPQDPLERLSGVVDELVAHGLSPQLAATINDEAAQLMPLSPSPSLKPLLREALARRVPIATPRRGANGGVVGFVGPGGSGKTRCVARMATAYATRSSLPVACVTLRAEDHGAELSRLLASIGVPIHAEDDAESAAARIDALRGSTLVLLDTPSLSPRAEAERRVLARELEQLRVDELHLCIPATIAPGPARAIAASAGELGAHAMAITHADETDDLGAVVELAIDTRLPISFLARGTALGSGLHPAVADDLALALVP